MTFIEKRSIIEVSIDAVEAEQRQQALTYLLLIPYRGPAEVIEAAHSLNIDSTGGGKHYARSNPAYISRTDRL